MASIVRHRTGSWEIRESLRTPAGPRSRTLASFRELTPEVLEHARARASRPFDAESVKRSAHRKGAPVARAAEQVATQRLLAQLDAGARLPPGWRAMLAETLETSASPRTTEPRVSAQAQSARGWAPASLSDRGAALVDLLLLADALPAPRARPERFPRLVSRPDAVATAAA